MTTTQTALEPGDAVPNFVLSDVRGEASGPVIDSRGKPLTLVFCTAEFERNLAPFATEAARLRSVTDLSIVTPLSIERNRELAQRLDLPWGVLADSAGDVTAHFTFQGGGAPRPALTTIILDSGLRVLATERDGMPERHVD